MNKATKFTLVLSGWVTLWLTVGMFWTFVNEWLSKLNWFGDTLRKEGLVGPDGWHDWGARHYYYFWICIFLFIMAFARIAIWAINYWDED